jgi:FkbM family methyltransferase
MNFVSYAQNLEDVMLWRALGSIDRGFYVDVGAAWPTQDSVTKAFYERGWNGINIEPNPSFAAQLEKERPRDINLPIAAGCLEGSLVLSIIPNTGLSTLDSQINQIHASHGWHSEQLEVKVSTLKNILDYHLKEIQDIHFLKIDVEGAEYDVIKGNDWKKYRPWILIIESTLPLSEEQVYAQWEDFLISADYVYCYADGLNRFYVAKEHLRLAKYLKYPPNIFDKYVHCQEYETIELQRQLVASRNREIQKTEQLQATIADIYSSKTWLIAERLKSVFFIFKTWLRLLKYPIEVLSILMDYVGKIITRTKHSPKLRSIAFAIVKTLKRMRLYQLFPSIILRRMHPCAKLLLNRQNKSEIRIVLSARGQLIYDRLKKATFCQ